MQILPIGQNMPVNSKPSFKAQSPLLEQAKIINNIISKNLLTQNNCPKQVEQAITNCDKFISNVSSDNVESFCRLALGKKGSKKIKEISKQNPMIQNFLSSIEKKLGKDLMKIFK
ncbi:MAG: hypothetical protein MJ229_02440 [bacterium]|nr:hypothetical protein [bacterium]